MSTGKLVALVVVVFLGVCLLGGGCFYSSTYNKAVVLKNQAIGQEKDNQQSLGSLINILQEKAGVANAGAEQVKELAKVVANPRAGGGLMKWVQEANPSFDMSLFQDLSSEITAQFTTFKNQQKALIDTEREYNNLRQGFWTGFVVGSWPDLKITIVLSDASIEAFESGKMAPLNLMGASKPAER